MRATIFMLLTLLATGCGVGYRDLRSVEAQPLGGALAFLDADTDTLIIVDPNSGAGADGRRKLERIGAGVAPAWARAVQRPDDAATTQVLIADPGGAQILVVRDESGATDALDTGVPLGEVDVSADGRYGLAYQPEGSVPTESLFAFPNTIAILDLHPDSPGAVTTRLGAGGARPIKAVFSAPLRLRRTVLSGTSATDEIQDLRVALVFVRGGLVPVDLERGVAGAFVPLTVANDREVRPAEVLFTNNVGDGIVGSIDGVERAFARTTAGELFVLAISLAGNGASPLTVALENVVTPDATVSDIELFFNNEGNSLLLAAAGNELILVDGYSGVAQRFDAPTFTDALVRFDDPLSGDALSLGYSRAQPGYHLLRVDPLKLSQRRSTGIETMVLGSRVRDIDIGSVTARAVLRYVNPRDLGILDLTRDGDVLDMSFSTAPSARALVDKGERMLLVSESPEDNEPHLAEVTLEGSFSSRDVRLDADAVAVGRVGDFIWVDHAGSTRDVTFFPIDDLSREAAIAFHGVFFARLVDEEPPDDNRGDPQ